MFRILPRQSWMELSSLSLTGVLNYQALYNYGVLISVKVVVLTSEAGRTALGDELSVPRDGKPFVHCPLLSGGRCWSLDHVF